MKKTIWLTRTLVLGSLFFLLAVPIEIEAGRPVSGMLVISAEPEQESSPAIAYNSQRREYLAGAVRQGGSLCI